MSDWVACVCVWTICNNEDGFFFEIRESAKFEDHAGADPRLSSKSKKSAETAEVELEEPGGRGKQLRHRCQTGHNGPALRFSPEPSTGTRALDFDYFSYVTGLE
jgi:hypothetical protein